ncbi:cyclic di-GMP binding protein [Spirochaetia bacterium]|nr:cyclic di-GMP binding protein [Spirochaetia bacterium]
MGVLTSQKIAAYYERYRGIDVTYTKEIIQVTGMVTQQIFLKCMGDFWPCVVYSSSFAGAKIVVSIKTGLVDKLTQANNSASLRFCFKTQESASPVAFFVAVRSMGYSPYGGSKDMAMFTLQFTQRPPDDLIEIMGRLLDANINSAKRRDERVIITADSARRLRILTKESAVFIQGVPRHCILRDISFSGAKLIMMGVAKFLLDKESALRIDFEDPRESFLMRGKFIRVENVEGRKDLVALAILFTEAVVPMGFKIRLNDFLSQIRVDNRNEEKAPPAAKKTAPQDEAGVPEAEDTGVSADTETTAEGTAEVEKVSENLEPAENLPETAAE